MKPKMIIIYFGELWLKGRNRKQFINIVLNNIKASLSKENYDKIEDNRDRVLVHLNKDSNAQSIKKKLSFVFGISWIASSIKVKSDMESICKGVVSASGKKA